MITLEGNLLFLNGSRRDAKSEGQMLSFEGASGDFLAILNALLFADQTAEDGIQQPTMPDFDAVMQNLFLADTNRQSEMPLLQELIKLSGEHILPAQASSELMAQVANFWQALMAENPQLAEQIKGVLSELKNRPPAEAANLLRELNRLIIGEQPVDQQVIAKLEQLLTGEKTGVSADLGNAQNMPHKARQLEAALLQLNHELNKPVVKAEVTPALAEKPAGNITVRPVEQAADSGFYQSNQQSFDRPTAQDVNRQPGASQIQTKLNFTVNTANLTVNSANTLQQPTESVPLEQLAARISNLVKEMAVRRQPNQATTMRIKLQPEHLGEVTIRLTYQRGELNTHIYATTAHAKEALEAVLPQIRETLVQQSIKLNEAAVFLGQQGSQWNNGGYRQPAKRHWASAGVYRAPGNELPISGLAAADKAKVSGGLSILI